MVTIFQNLQLTGLLNFCKIAGQWDDIHQLRFPVMAERKNLMQAPSFP